MAEANDRPTPGDSDGEGLPEGACADRATLARIVVLYAPDALFFGFLFTVVPFQLRLDGGGAALSTAVGWLALPLGFAFLWAPFVDARQLPGLGRRSGWAGLCQIAAASSFAAAALVFHLAPGLAGPAAALVPSLPAAFLFATRNIALNAWMRESLADRDVSVAVGVRCAGAAVGNWLGAGALAGGFDALGWTGAFAALAVAALASALALWRLPGQAERADRSDVVGLMPTIRAMSATPGVLRRAASVAILSAVMAPPAGLGVLAFADNGLSARELGYAVGYTGAAAAALGAFAGGRLAKVFGLKAMLIASAFLQGALSLGWAAFAALAAPGSFALGLGLMTAQYGLFAAMAALWMTAVIRIASRERAATELALLNAMLLLAGIMAPTVAGSAADLLGSLSLAFVGLAALACATCLLAPVAAGAAPEPSAPETLEPAPRA